MFSIKDLERICTTLDAKKFKQQLGPFVLIQRPEKEVVVPANKTAVMGNPWGPEATSVAKPGQVEAGTLSLLFQFETLVVATLPPLDGVDALTVGRQADCDLVLTHSSVSKRHATLRWDEVSKRATIEDLQSTNGTFLNAASRIRNETVLKDGDILSFGDVQFWFLITDTLHQKLHNQRTTSGSFRLV